MAWTVTRNPAGDYECHDGDRLRAVISRRAKSANPWQVHRVAANGTLGGADGFKTLRAATIFVTENPAVWGC